MGRPILVLGATGQVGHELLRTLAPLAPVQGVLRASLDLTKVDSMASLIKATRPLAIVNAAAYTAVDKAESEPELAMQINGIAPGVMAELAAASGACFVHYSTDYVFDGQADSPYSEDTPTSPLGVYGRTKLAGEQAVMAAGDAAIVLRTCWVYGTRGRNFLLTMERLARERRKLRVVDDQLGSPTWSRFIAETTAAILARCALSPAQLRERRGVYHLAATEHTSWCGFARAIVAHLGDCDDVEVEAIATSDYPTPARRPAYSVLDTRRICASFGLHMPSWTAMLADAVAERRPS